MFSMLITATAKLSEDDFVFSVQLVFLGDIILAFADLADEGEFYTMFFLGHNGIICEILV